MRSSSRSFQRISSSTVSPVTGGRRSSAASIDSASGSVSRTRDSWRLAPVTATAAAASVGVVGQEFGRVRLGDDQALEGEPACRRCRRTLDRLLESVHQQSVA